MNSRAGQAIGGRSLTRGYRGSPCHSLDRGRRRGDGTARSRPPPHRADEALLVRRRCGTLSAGTASDFCIGTYPWRQAAASRALGAKKTRRRRLPAYSCSVHTLSRLAARGGRLDSPDDAQADRREADVRRRAAAFVGRRAAGLPTPGPVAAGCCLRAKRSSALDRRLASRGSASCAPAWLCSKGQVRRWHASSARAGRGRWR